MHKSACNTVDRIGPRHICRWRSTKYKRDHRQLGGLLRPCRERPRRRAAEQGDELAAADHSITSSAMATNVDGTTRPSALAALRLITNSYFVGSWAGRSAGLVPLRMRST